MTHITRVALALVAVSVAIPASASTIQVDSIFREIRQVLNEHAFEDPTVFPGIPLRTISSSAVGDFDESFAESYVTGDSVGYTYDILVRQTSSLSSTSIVVDLETQLSIDPPQYPSNSNYGATPFPWTPERLRSPAFPVLS